MRLIALFPIRNDALSGVNKIHSFYCMRPRNENYREFDERKYLKLCENRNLSYCKFVLFRQIKIV